MRYEVDKEQDTSRGFTTMDDLRSCKQLKRRRMTGKSYKTMDFSNMGSGVDSPHDNAAASVQEDLVDEDYQEYLNYILGLQDEIDHEYSTFLDKLKQDGNSFMLEVMFNGEMCRVRYEMGNNPTPYDRPANVKKSQGKVSTTHGVRTRKNKSPLHCTNVAQKKDNRSNIRAAVSVGRSSKAKSERDEGCSGSGEVLLRDLFTIDSGNHMILKAKGVNPVIYDETPEHSSYSESSSDSEIVVMDTDPYRHENTPFIAKKSEYIDLTTDEEDIQLVHNDDSQFRKGLMETLAAPYDEGEYKDRMLEVRRQRNKECERELRSGRTMPLPLNAFFDSYLDQYSDLKEKIEQFSEPDNALFLLRGFFYWLEHSPLERSFMPWLDPSLLNMLADSKSRIMQQHESSVDS